MMLMSYERNPYSELLSKVIPKDLAVISIFSLASLIAWLIAACYICETFATSYLVLLILTSLILANSVRRPTLSKLYQ